MTAQTIPEKEPEVVAMVQAWHQEALRRFRAGSATGNDIRVSALVIAQMALEDTISDEGKRKFRAALRRLPDQGGPR